MHRSHYSISSHLVNQYELSSTRKQKQQWPSKAAIQNNISMALENNLSLRNLWLRLIRVVVSRVKSNTLYISLNSCLGLRTQIRLKVRKWVSKGNNSTSEKETSPKCPRLSDWSDSGSDRSNHPNNWDAFTVRSIGQRANQSDLGVSLGLLLFIFANRSNLGVSLGLLLFIFFFAWALLATQPQSILK